MSLYLLPPPIWHELFVRLVLLSPKTSDLLVLWKYFINLLMQSARSPLRILPCFHWLVVHQMPFIVMSIHPLSLTANPMLGQETRAHPRWHQVIVWVASSWLGWKVRRTASHTHIQSYRQWRDCNLTFMPSSQWMIQQFFLKNKTFIK